MKPIYHPMKAALLLSLITAASFSGCAKQEPLPPPVVQEAPKPTSEQEVATLTKKAEAGDATSQIALAKRYAIGNGVPKDTAKQMMWYERAAGQDNPEAQYSVGMIYYEGVSVAKDYSKAAEWFQKAVNKGYAAAQFKLGIMYFKGEGLTKDEEKFIDLIKKSAEQGFPDAQSSLGFRYLFGRGVPQDDKKAFSLYQKAADQGVVNAQNAIGMMYKNGTGVPKDATKARLWFEKAAVQGDDGAQYNLGIEYLRGDGAPLDAVLAYAWLNLAASAGGELTRPMAFEARLNTERLLTTEELAEAQQISSAWKVGQRIVRSGRQSLTNPAQTGVLSKRATGTIFLVSESGHAITNHHVTQDCAELRISGRDGVAKLIVDDTVNDISLVQIPGAVTVTASIATDPQKLRQGENIYVYGFPLNALLSTGGNFTPGVVSAMTGLGNNTNQIQITAPIQPGSSGSPLLNKNGEVVGVVSMKLSDSKMAKATGSVAQNVNFAVSGQTLKTFLDTNKVAYSTGGFFLREKSTADLADEARKWTLVVECWK